MIEHQVVVVFDVTAHDVLDAGRAVVGLLNGTRSRFLLPGGLPADSKIESWWMPEEPLRSEVDRNDNAPMHLEPSDPPQDIYVEDDAEDEPTIWLHNPAEPDRPMALLSPGNLGRRGRELLWEHIVRGLPTSAPVSS